MDAKQVPDKEPRFLRAASNQHRESATLTNLVSSLVTVCSVTVLYLIATSQPHHPGNFDRKLSVPADQNENISSSEHMSGNISVSRPGVSELCLCNPTATQVYLSVTIAPSLSITSAFVSNSGPCSCFGRASLPGHAREGQPFRCWYIRRGDSHFSPCQGRGQFYYRSNSNLMGQYLCSGSPPVCRYNGFCVQPRCRQYPQV